ncbi:MAG: serine hydrolase [Chitinophagaceae bacterium]
MQKWIIAISLMALSCKSNEQKAQPQMPADEVKRLGDSIQQYMDTLLNSAGFSGGILVAKNDSILYEHYQGFSDAAKATAINDTTPFHVASTSKTFTSTAILQLIHQGKLQLTDKVQQFYPGFPYPDITIKNLLSHTSGLQNYAYFFPKFGWNKKKTATNEDVLDLIISKKPPLTHPTGSKFEYCNTNFVLLALIVEQISGQAFPEYVREKIFEPAGMTHSFILSINDTAKYLPSFKANGAIYNFEYVDAIYGDKNVYTTCRDLMAYDKAIRNHLVLDSASYNMAWTPQQRDTHYHDTTEYYGLGWRLKVWPGGNKIVYHNGWWHGNNSIFQRLYQDTAVIIVTGNVFNRRIYHVPHVANYFRPYYEEMNLEKDDSEGDSTAAKKTDISPKKQKPATKSRKKK